MTAHDCIMGIVSLFFEKLFQNILHHHFDNGSFLLWDNVISIRCPLLVLRISTLYVAVSLSNIVCFPEYTTLILVSQYLTFLRGRVFAFGSNAILAPFLIP